VAHGVNTFALTDGGVLRHALPIFLATAPNAALENRTLNFARASGRARDDRINAPLPAAGEREIQEHEAEQRRDLATVGDGPEVARSVSQEIRHRHLARKQKR